MVPGGKAVMGQGRKGKRLRFIYILCLHIHGLAAVQILFRDVASLKSVSVNGMFPQWTRGAMAERPCALYYGKGQNRGEALCGFKTKGKGWAYSTLADLEACIFLEQKWRQGSLGECCFPGAHDFEQDAVMLGKCEHR